MLLSELPFTDKMVKETKALRSVGRQVRNQKQNLKLAFTLSRAARVNALPFTPLASGERHIWRPDGLRPVLREAGANSPALHRPGTVFDNHNNERDRPERSSPMGRGGILPELARRNVPAIRSSGHMTTDDIEDNNIPLAPLDERVGSADTSESERLQIGVDGQLLVPICPVLYLVRDPKYAPEDYATLPKRIILNRSHLVLGRGRQSDVVFDSRKRPSIVSKSEFQTFPCITFVNKHGAADTSRCACDCKGKGKTI